MVVSPASARRRCSRASALQGMHLAEEGAVSPEQVRSLAKRVVPTGRVCGTAIGMPWAPTTRRTPKARHSWRTASTKPPSGSPARRRAAAGTAPRRRPDDPVEDQRGVLVVGVVVGVEGHERPPRAVVDERVHVEAGHHLVLEGVQQVLGQRGPDHARVDEPVEGHEHQRCRLRLAGGVGLQAKQWRVRRHGVSFRRPLNAPTRADFVPSVARMMPGSIDDRNA